jgi:hypothetical protein
MGSTLIFAFQVATNLLVYSLIARWYLAPRLAALPLPAALRPLLLFHLLRTMGAVFLVPAVTSTPLPAAFAVPGAIGDLLAVALAAAALAALAAGWRSALAVVWVFNVAGTLDFLLAFGQGARLGLASDYSLGAAWFIPTFFVPAFLVSHGLIFLLLLTRAREYRPFRPLSPVANPA